MRDGADAVLPYDKKRGVVTHNAMVVYSEMLRQVCRDYAGLPDARTLTISEIVWFYNGLRGELKTATKPRAK